jgi:cation diffusion facilitator family transporter
MHRDGIDRWRHDHVFGQDRKRPGEVRTLLIVALTAVMMVVEVSAGLVFGSMALLADGLHMASHAVALGVTVVAYVVSRRLAADRRFAFGVGKINSLAGFASAVMLLGFALLMVTESLDRMVDPVAIAFDQALIVAVVGLLVNGFSAWVLASTPHDHGHGHAHGHGHGHAHGHGHDHNLRGAYLHVLADALTSFLAIFALLAAKYFGAMWLDPAMGLVGAALVAHWSLGLIRDTARVLLDFQAGGEVEDQIVRAIEHDAGDRVSDLHVWRIGHGLFAAEIGVVTHADKGPGDFRTRIPEHLNIVHATIEVHRCPG